MRCWARAEPGRHRLHAAGRGGLSRFCAVFSSHFPPVAGPVRSARDDDRQLLRQFGRPAFACSGAAARLRSAAAPSRARSPR
ncbi:MAG: DUF3048 domain-containing protein [Streptosporangiaceae bacterium]